MPDVRIFKSDAKAIQQRNLELHARLSKLPVSILTHDVQYWRTQLKLLVPIGDYHQIDNYLSKYKLVLIDSGLNLNLIITKLQLKRIQFSTIN